MAFSAPFTVIDVNNCPFYKREDRFFLDEKSVNLPGEQPACLILVRELTALLFTFLADSVQDIPDRGAVFNCGGCTGLIKFKSDEEGAKRVVQTVQDAGDNGTSAIPAFEGHLHVLRPAELLQVFHMHQKSGNLIFDLSQGPARVTFRDGALIAARYGDFDNQEAIYAILAEQEGSFRFEPDLPPEDTRARELGDFMMILMEGLRRLNKED